MGLNTSYPSNISPNPTVPALSSTFPFGTRPIRGMNIGGWLSTEPFITPSLFNRTSTNQPNFPDEYTLCSTLGKEVAASVLEQHYASFVRPQTFADIRAAGFDHVRLGFPYWCIATYPGDPYIEGTCWRYLLRAIEWARSQGLRVALDLHSAPGGQNGWNHSGRDGVIGWLNGTASGSLNAERTLIIHGQLAEFFAQDRYRGLVTLYGILNEPHMLNLKRSSVFNWTSVAIQQLRSSPLPNDTVLVVSDGFLPLNTWHAALPAVANPAQERVLLDAHQYTIFDPEQIQLDHSAKLEFACQGWSQQVKMSMDPNQGFGSFVCGEWGVADTDCAPWVNGVDKGSRWEGTLVIGPGNVDTTADKDHSTSSSGEGGPHPSCPGQKGCTCASAVADPSTYNETYKKWLRLFAEAQISSFNGGWGNFYWTWDVEPLGTAQWSWKKARDAGFAPMDVSEGAELWDCSGETKGAGLVTDWVGMGLSEGY